jgi:hypothetical protein
MSELYFVKRERKSLRTLRIEFGESKDKYLLKLIDGEINLKGKSEFSPIESVYEDEQEMLKKVWETRKQLSEERWILKTKEESPQTTQTSFITLSHLWGPLYNPFTNRNA